MARRIGLEDFQPHGYTSGPFLPIATARSAGRAEISPSFFAPDRAAASPPVPRKFALQRPPEVTDARRTTSVLDFRRLGLLAAVFCCAATAGCVQRRLTIRSNPPGALVIIDQWNIGITPCSTDYIYYGKRHIQLIRDGYETVNDDRWILPPWYEIPPIDFVSENFIPYELRDERIIDYQLTPQKVASTERLLGRAENLRQSTRLESAAPSRTSGWFSGLFGPATPRAPSPHAVPGSAVQFPPTFGSPGHPSPAYPARTNPVPAYPPRTYPRADIPPPRVGR